MQGDPNFRRILLKLSGESLMGPKDFGLHQKTINRICDEIKLILKNKIQICLVIGGGNIFRGISQAAENFERTSADYMGMLATVINAVAVQNILESKGVETRVLSAIPMSPICEAYNRKKALRHLEKGRVIIFAAGTGNPLFTTDPDSKAFPIIAPDTFSISFILLMSSFPLIPPEAISGTCDSEEYFFNPSKSGPLIIPSLLISV